MKLLLVKSFWVCSIIFMSLTTMYAEDNLQFELSKEKIERLWISEIKNGIYQVNVQLNELNKDNFASLTENNIGKKLVITILGQTYMKAVISGKIDSGIISLGTYNSEEDAKIIADKLNLEYITKKITKELKNNGCRDDRK